MSATAGEMLAAGDLAGRIGPRRAGRPTSARCVRHWMTHGVFGVKLRHVEEVGIYLNTWAWYEEFRAAVSEARAAARRRGLEAVRSARGSAKRAAKAMKRLAEMDRK